MRWIWIDKFTEFVSGSHAVAVKNVTLAEEFLQDHFPGYPVMPPSLVIEGMAQTAGILVGEARGFRENVILAKIREAQFSDYAVPGDRLSYHARMESITDAAAATVGEVLLNDRAIGQVNLMFSHVGQSGAAMGLPSHNFVFTEQFMRLFERFRDGVVASAGPSDVDRAASCQP
ncbi:MAG: beta-hydroxyacyl-ACP dehydratase [Phycisphaerales bacterium]|nr:beta-hydroxyacyl-ACP dehydratase [Phycisphaerales bacterium]